MGVWIEHHSLLLASEHTFCMQIQSATPLSRHHYILPIDRHAFLCSGPSARRRCCSAENYSNFHRPWEWGNNTDFLLPSPPPPLHNLSECCYHLYVNFHCNHHYEAKWPGRQEGSSASNERISLSLLVTFVSAAAADKILATTTPFVVISKLATSTWSADVQ